MNLTNHKAVMTKALGGLVEVEFNRVIYARRYRRTCYGIREAAKKASKKGNEVGSEFWDTSPWDGLFFEIVRPVSRTNIPAHSAILKIQPTTLKVLGIVSGKEKGDG